MRETRVNLKHLLEDIRDGYSAPIEEVIIVELIANALDSQASRIDFLLNPGEGTFGVVDNGSGMKRNAVKEYHNIAASTKVRGKGIGFAGLGAKLALLVAKSVVTETKGGNGSRCATAWYLQNEQRAPWKFVPSAGKVTSPRGTAVTIDLATLASPFLSPSFVAETVRKHFYPLLHPQFIDAILQHIYKRGVVFYINGERVGLEQADVDESFQVFRVTVGRARKQLAGFGYLARAHQELSPELAGVGISTYGKVIKHGWDWIGIVPKSLPGIYGMVEIPALADILTTNKNDFLRDAASLKKYYKYRKAIQEAIFPLLGKLGEERMSFESDLKRLRPLEKEIEKTLGRLLPDFPELTPLVGSGRRSRTGTIAEPELLPVHIVVPEKPQAEKQEEKGEKREKTRERGQQQLKKELPGLSIGFERDTVKEDLAKIIHNTIWINTAHPAYDKSRQDKLEEYHIFLCVAWVLSQFIEENRSPQDFISRFLASWGKRYPGTFKMFHNA